MAEKRARTVVELFPEQGFGGVPLDDAEDSGPPVDDADDDDAVKGKLDDVRQGQRRKRSRVKRLNEGDWQELKPRHLRGKRRDEIVARQLASLAKTPRSGPAEEVTQANVLQAQLMRLLRPKARRWAIYEWFYSPVDLAWFRVNDFVEVLQARGTPALSPNRIVSWH